MAHVSFRSVHAAGIRQTLRLATLTVAVAAMASSSPAGASIWTRADNNNDGVLTKTEFVGFLRQVFDRLDLDADGVVSRAEMDSRTGGQTSASMGATVETAATTASGQSGSGGGGNLSRVVERIASTDRDKDGNVTWEELASAADRLFARRDTDSDGAVPVDEMGKRK